MSRYSVTRDELIDAIANIEVRNVRVDGPAKGLAVADDFADAILFQLTPAATPGWLTLGELLDAVLIVDAHIDSATSQDYREQPLAAHWARVTKVCSEAGEVMDALSAWTGENPRKGVCGTLDDLLGELGDTASAAICAIQHLTKDTDATWAVVSAALIKARKRVDEHAGTVTP